MAKRSSSEQSFAALVISPTRELAQQIHTVALIFSKCFEQMGISLPAVLCIGGNDLNLNTLELEKNPSLIIGTPGRLQDLVTKHQRSFKNLEGN